MERDRDHFRQQAERARRWAEWLPDPLDKERLEAAARDYEEKAKRADQSQHRRWTRRHVVSRDMA